MTILRTMSSQRTTALFGWSILVALTLLMMLNAVLLYAVIGDTALDRTTAIVFGGLGVLAFAVAYRGLKRASEWSWKTMWIVVGLLAVLALHMLSVGRMDLAGLYAGMGVFGVVGLVMARRGGVFGR